MNSNEKISVVIPAYMEEENLRVLLPRLAKTLSKCGHEYEVLVIGTTEEHDDTKEVCAQYGARYIPRENRNCYGDAVRTGIKCATGELTIFMDADGSHSPEFVKHLLEQRNGVDVVIASRYVAGGATDNPHILIWMSWIVNVCYSVVLKLKCKDVSNSFKLYKTRQLKDLDLHSTNFEIVEEILYKLVKGNPALKVKEIPATFRKRMFGSTKRNLILFVLGYIVTLLKLRFGK